jgi:peptide/nickel transport system ATP-binding protein
MEKLIPIIVLTGFLGSGKTTLINRILSQGHGKRLGVLVNEFGELGIDGSLIKNSAGPMVELANGCVCCATRGDLFAALDQLLSASTTDEKLDGIIIETSGLANPGPVIAQLQDYQSVKPVRFDSVVTVVDSDNFDRNLDNAEVAFEQITMADLLIVNKADTVDEETLGLIEQGLRKLNTDAMLVRSVQCDVPLALLMGDGAAEVPENLSIDGQRCTHDHCTNHGVDNGDSHDHVHCHEHGDSHDHGGVHNHDHSHNADHNHGHEAFNSVVLRSRSAMDFDRFSAWVDALPSTVFRVKGFVRFVDRDEPVIVHVVGRRRSIEAAGRSDISGSTLVVIGLGLDGAELQQRLDQCAMAMDGAVGKADQTHLAETDKRQATGADQELILRVQDQSVNISTEYGSAQPLRGVSFTVQPGEFLGIVGESGSGKSITFLSMLRLMPSILKCEIQGSALFDGRELSTMAVKDIRKLLGSDLSIIFQDPLAALNPVFRIGEQIADVIRTHEPGVSKAQAHARAVEVLKLVRIPNAEARVNDYPHQFSGGMRQRVLIAMAIVCKPKLLVADEPTTALDVTVQAEILALLDQLRRELSMSIIFITHDLGVVARYADRVAVMYAGRIVEHGPVRTLFATSAHPYTRALLSTVPRIGSASSRLVAIKGEAPSITSVQPGCAFQPRCQRSNGRERCVETRPVLTDVEGVGVHQAACHFARETDPVIASDEHTPKVSAASAGAEVVLRVKNLTKRFELPKKAGAVHAVSDVSFELYKGETLGVVGESGSGKSTLMRCVMQLISPTSGSVALEGREIAEADKDSIKFLRDRMQLVFQDARSAINPRMTVGASVGEPLIIRGQWKNDGAQRVHKLLQRVGLSADHALRYPYEFSGGQLQRVGIARALVLNPSIVVLDEPISSLDVSIRAQIINLLKQLQDEFALSYLFVAHDLSVVHHISDRIAVMYLGRIVEIGTADSVCRSPLHPYTQLLVASIPEADPEVAREFALPEMVGERPDPINPPSGCAFHTRCSLAPVLAASGKYETVAAASRQIPIRCVNEIPELRTHSNGQCAACHFTN